MIDRRARSLFTPTHGITLEALKLLFVPLGGDGRQRQLSIMELVHVSTVRRQSSSVSVASNGWDGPTGFAMLTHHTGQRMRIDLYISVQYVLCVGVEWLRDRKGPERRPF